MHAEFRDSEADESDERKHRKGFFRAGFFLFASLKNQKVNISDKKFNCNFQEKPL